MPASNLIRLPSRISVRPGRVALAPSSSPFRRLPDSYKPAHPTTSTSIAPHSRSFHCTPPPATRNQAVANNFFCKSSTNPAAKMSTMPATHGHSEACCNIPPVVTTGYKAKGSYEELGGFNSCNHGPFCNFCRASHLRPLKLTACPRRNRTLRRHKGHRRHLRHLRLFRPDRPGRRHPGDQRRTHQVQGVHSGLVRGRALPHRMVRDNLNPPAPPNSVAIRFCPIIDPWACDDRYPPDNEDKQKKLGAFFQKYPPQSVADKVPAYVNALKEKNPSIKSWAIIGVRFCPSRLLPSPPLPVSISQLPKLKPTPR